MFKNIDGFVNVIIDKVETIRFFEFAGLSFDIFYLNDFILFLLLLILSIVLMYIAIRSIKKLLVKYKRKPSLEEEHKKFLGSHALFKDKDKTFKELKEIENKLLIKGEKVEVDAMTAMYVMAHHRNYGAVINEEGKIILDVKKEQQEGSALKGTVSLGGTESKGVLFFKGEQKQQLPMTFNPTNIKHLSDDSFEIEHEDGSKSIFAYEDGYPVLQSIQKDEMPEKQGRKQNEPQTNRAQDGVIQRLDEIAQKVSGMENSIKKASDEKLTTVDSVKKQEKSELIKNDSTAIQDEDIAKYENLYALVSGKEETDEGQVVEQIRKARKSSNKNTTVSKTEKTQKAIEHNSSATPTVTNTPTSNDSKPIQGTKRSISNTNSQDELEFSHSVLALEWGKDELFEDSESWSADAQLGLVFEGMLEMQKYLSSKGLQVFYRYIHNEKEVFFVETNFLAVVFMRAYAKAHRSDFQGAYLSRVKGVKPEMLDVIHRLNRLSREEGDNTFIKIADGKYFYSPVIIHSEEENKQGICYRVIATRIFPEILGEVAYPLVSRFRELPDMQQLAFGKVANIRCPEDSHTIKVSLSEIEKLLAPTLI